MISETPQGGTDPLDPFGKGRRYTEEVAIFVYGILAGMKAKGHIAGGGAYALSEKGYAIYMRLLTEGFDPTPAEMEWALQAIQQGEAANGADPLSKTP